MALSKRIRLPPEWDIIEFVDGYRAWIMGAVVVMKNNIDWIKYYLYPTDELKRRYNLTSEKLDSDSCLEAEYPKDMIIILNEDDPARKVKFCYLNFEGKRTPTTDKMLGMKTILSNSDIIGMPTIIERWAKENNISNEKVDLFKQEILPVIRSISEPDEIMKLKRIISDIRAENASIMEDNFIAQTNMSKYIKEKFMSIADAVMPMIKKGIEIEEKQNENVNRGRQ